MAITDKVIELETKKTGRNVALIVIAAVMAALAVVMVVLYVTKETPTEPPSVEMIALASSDLHTDTDAESDDITYKVAPGCGYTLDFDVVLKGNASPDEVNPLLKFDCDVEGVLSYEKGTLVMQKEPLDSTEAGEGEDDPNKPYIYKYKYEFKVNTNMSAGTRFNIVVSSAFSRDARNTVKFLVAESHTEYLDLKADEENNHYLDAFHYEGTKKVDAKPVALVLDDDSTERALHYKLANPISFYNSGEFRSLNNTYIVNFEQLGKEGTHGSDFAKVMQGSGFGGNFDQVRVSVSDYDEKTGKYKDYVEMGSASKTNNLTVRLTPEGGYCNSFFHFLANGVGKSKIKIEANAYNNYSVKPYIIIDVEFISYDSLDYVSKIIFNNPYLGGEESTTLDLYYGNDITNTKSFVLSDFISVIQGGTVNRNPKWAQSNAIYAYVSDASGNVVTGANSLLQRGDGGDFSVKMSSPKVETGTAYVTVRDYDKGNPLEKVQTIIAINIHGSIDDVTLTSPSGVLNKKYASGDTGEVSAAYTVGQAVDAASFDKYSKSLNSYLTVNYPAKLTVPALNNAGEVTNADNTIVFDGFTVLKNGEIRLNPTLTQESGNRQTLASGLSFKIGKDVADGDYVFEFLLAPQGLKKDDGVYTEAERSKITLTVSVTKLADNIEVNEDFEFNAATNDSHTIFEVIGKEGSVTNARLVIGIGTGSEGYTGFTIKDLIRYGYGDCSYSSDEYGLNFEKVEIIGTGDTTLGSVFRGGDVTRGFIVPASTAPAKQIDIKFNGHTDIKLFIEYRYVVGRIALSRGKESDWITNYNSFVYEKPYESGATYEIGNSELDGVKLYATNGAEITSEEYMMHDELYSMDVALVLHGTASHLLRKAQIGYHTFYFDENISDEELDRIVKAGEEEAVKYAYFRTYPNANTANYNLTALTDLFALSVSRIGSDALEYPNDASMLTVRIYYSYNVDKIETTSSNVVIHKHNATVKPDNDQLLICSTYRLVRAFDEVRLYEDDNYETELPKEDGKYALSVLSGNYVDLYYSGVIFYEDESGETKKFVVERDNSCEIPVNGYEVYYVRDANINEKDGKPYVECKPENGTLKRNISVYEIGLSGARRKNTAVTVSFANTVVNIEKIELSSKPDYSDDLSSVELYANAGENKDLRIYYRITYAAYNSLNNAYDDIRTSWQESVFERGGESDPRPSTELSGSEADGYVRVEEKCLILKLKPGAANGKYSFKMEAASNTATSASIDITVTTLIDPASLSVAVDGDEENKFGVGSGHTIDYDYLVNGTNVHTFDFDFVNKDGTTVDKKTLSFAASLTDSKGEAFSSEIGLKGYYYTGTQKYPGGAHPEINNYVLELPNVSISGARLVLTVTQNETDYSIEIVFNVHMPVMSVELTVDGAKPAGSRLSLVTGGGSGYTDYALASLVNGDDALRMPSECSVEFTLESDGDISDIYEIINGNTLRVYDSALSAPAASLVLTATDARTGTSKSARISLALSTTEVAFKRVSGGERTQRDNEEFDYEATVTNAGSGATVTKGITYEYTVISGNITVTRNPSVPSRFKPEGSYGTFAVTAKYVSGEKTYTAVATVKVCVPVNAISLSRDGGADAITLIKGQTEKNAVAVSVSSAVAGVSPVVSRITVASSNDGIAAVTYADGVVTVTPKSKGTVTVTVTAYTEDGDYTKNAVKTFTVAVLEPVLSVRLSSDKYDVLDLPAEDRDRRQDIEYDITDAGAFRKEELDIYVTDFTLSGSALSVRHRGGKEFYVEVPSSLTADALGRYDLTLIVTLNGVSLSAGFTFSLVNEKFTPVMELKQSGADVPSDGGYYVLDKSKANYLVYSASAAVVGIASGEYECSFSSDAATINSSGTDHSGTITNLKSLEVGSVFRITMSTTLLGKTYENYVDCIVTDSSAMTATLYVSDTDSVTVSGNTIGGGTAVTGTPYVDYETAPKYLTVAVLFKNAPSAVLSSVATDFTVSNNANLTEVRREVKVAGANFYFIAVYTIDTAGDVVIGVHSALLGGTSYAAPSVSATFKTHAPEFEIDPVSAIDPGSEGTISVRVKENDFMGNVEFTLVEDTYKFFTVSKTVTGEFKVTAKVNEGGGKETVRILATVKSGAYAGYTEILTVPVTIETYRVPTVVNVSSPLLYALGTFDLKTAVRGAITHDDADEFFDFSLVDMPTIDCGTVSGNIYTAPTACENGRVVTLDVRVKVTGGFYAGTNLYCTISITVAPTSATLTVSDSSVLPNGTVRFGGSVGIADGEYKVAYALDNPAAGYLRADSDDANVAIFTANQYGGNVTVTATISIVSGPFAGATYTRSATVKVNGLTLKSGETLSVKLGSSADIASKLLAGGTAISGGFFTIVPDGDDAIVGISDSVITASGDAKYANKVVRLNITYINGYDTYKGDFDFTIDALEVPKLEIEKSDTVYTVKEVSGARYKLEVISGASLVTLGSDDYGTYSAVRTFSVAPKPDTAGGVAIVRVSMLIADGDYEGTSYVGSEYTQTFEVEVEAADKPTITVSLADATDDDGKIHTVASDGYTVSDCAYSVSDGARITVDSQGNYSLTRNATQTTVTVTVRAIVRKAGAPYDGIVVEGTVTITVKATSSTSNRLTATLKYNDATNDAWIEVTAGSYAVLYKSFEVSAAQSSYIRIDSDGKLTLVRGDGMPSTITVTVKATVQERFTTRDYTATVSVSTSEKPVPAPTAVSLKKSDTNALEGKFDITPITSIEVISVSADSPYLTVVGDKGYRLTPDVAAQSVSVTVRYLVTSGVWKGNVLSYEGSVSVAALPELTVGYSVNAQGSGGTVTATASGATLLYAVSGADSSYIGLNSASGAFTFTDSGRAAKHTVTVTVTATLGSTHAYAGYAMTEQVEITTLPKVSATTEISEGGKSGVVKPAVSFGTARYFFALTSGSSVKLYADGKFDVVSAGNSVIKITALTSDGNVIELDYTLSAVTYAASYDGSKISSTLTGGTASYEYGVPEAYAKYISVNPATGAVTVKERDAVHVTVPVTVKATITSDGAYKGFVFTETVNVIVMANNGSIAATKDGDATVTDTAVTYVYTYALTSEYAEGAVISASASDTRVSVSVNEAENKITVIAERAEEDYTFSLTVTATLAGSVLSDKTVKTSVTDIAVEAVEASAPEVEETAA